MSGVSDKARFYLEQAVPQLQEFEQKKIFTKAEIKTLVKKRSDFEHKVLARGSTPTDFAKYAAWEISLEALRAKRVKRLKINGSTAHIGQARIFLIFDRGTRRHFGDLSLWMSYLQYCRDVKSTKKFKIVLTSAIRMHCTKAELWLYAAKYSLEEENDVNGARSYMQRGTRFCTGSRALWIEYAKLEMIFLAKISLRRRILGIDADPNAERIIEDSEQEEEGDAFDPAEDVITIPTMKASALRPAMIEGIMVDEEAKQDIMATPALNGAIALAIFDNAQKQPFYNAEAAEEFFNMFAAFPHVHCQAKILDHVLSSMTMQFPTEASTGSCLTKRPIIAIDPKTADFPMAFAALLEGMKSSMESTRDVPLLSQKIRTWLSPLLRVKGLDEGVLMVVRHTIKKL